MILTGKYLPERYVYKGFYTSAKICEAISEFMETLFIYAGEKLKNGGCT